MLFIAPANGGELCADDVEVFHSPAGPLLCLRRGTWHDVMYPKNADKISILIGLPERVYHNDRVWKDFEEPVQAVFE